MNILYIIDDLRAAGAQKHLVTLIKGLDHNVFKAYVVAVTGGGQCENELRDAGVSVHVCELESIYRINFFTTILFLIKFIYRHNINIVHTYLLLGDILGVLSALFTSAKVITTRREMGFWNKKHIIFTYKFLNIFTNRISAVSNAVRSFSIEQESIPHHNKIQVVYNGIDIKKFSQTGTVNSKAKRAELNIQEKQIAFGVIANLLPVKGHKFFIEAFSLLQAEERIPNICAFLIGDGKLRSELEEAVRLQGLQEKVFFLGKRNDVVELLEAIDIFVLPSLAEGMSNALIEALFMGKPVITTRTGGNPEVIGNNAGLLVEPGNASQLFKAMKRLVLDLKLRNKISTQAVCRAYNLFTAEKMCNSYMEIYRELTR